MKFLAIAWKSSVFPFQVVTESQRSINRTSTGDRPQPPRRHPPPPATPHLDSPPGPARQKAGGHGPPRRQRQDPVNLPPAVQARKEREGAPHEAAAAASSVVVVGDDVAPRDAKNFPRLALFFPAGRRASQPSLPRAPCLAFPLPTCPFLSPHPFLPLLLPLARLRNKTSRLPSRARTLPAPARSFAQLFGGPKAVRF